MSGQPHAPGTLTLGKYNDVRHNKQTRNILQARGTDLTQQNSLRQHFPWHYWTVPLQPHSLFVSCVPSLPACAPSLVDAWKAELLTHCHTRQMIHRCLTSYASPGAGAVTQESPTWENYKSYSICIFLNLEGTDNVRDHSVEGRKKYKDGTLRKLFDVFLTVHHSIDLFQITNLMHTSFILWQYTGCFSPCGHYCRRWFPRSLWSKKFI